MVVFPSPSAALDAAVAMQRELDRRNQSAEEQLSVRVGISLGESTYEDGDYFGVPVIEATRLCAQARGAQILTTETVRVIAARGQHDFRSLGPLELKGLAEPVPACELEWEPLDPSDYAMPLPPRLRGLPPIGYVGRIAEHERLERLLDDARGGDRQVVLLSGEPGIGKTRLCTNVAIEARGSGVLVLYGRCDEDVGAPYAPWVEALGHYVEHAPQDVLEAHADRHGGDLARLVPSVSRRVENLPPPRDSDPETERYMWWGAVTDLIEEASREQPVVLILDDLHAADKETVSLLMWLASSGAAMRLLLLATYRETDITRRHPLSELLAGLRREPGVTRIQLTGLGRGDIVALMEAAAGHRMDEPGSSSPARSCERPTATRSSSGSCSATSWSPGRSTRARAAAGCCALVG
jgi:AAA ATPase domain/Adenylate and Guanylate cyclase catalytic domain